ncbi:hypothetical protein G6F37_004321 [Rhizopus arrhizus]|nr:hypothetical protein G6F38_010058 [Rhizopus arrhizus]KAG1160067.1 hypothetical protein G6F37_004321 [Rhizopus arrhizus]
MYNITLFDLHLLVLNQKVDSKRTIKSWFNLTKADLKVWVNDDWFPTELSLGSLNKTWTFYAFLLSHDASMDPTSVNQSQHFVAFNVVQSPPVPIVIDKTPQQWIIALIVIASVSVILIVGAMAWYWTRKKMQKKSRLSKPDAMLIAEKFREVMSTSDMAAAKRNEKIAQDVLQKQLQSEVGASIIEIKQSGPSNLK